MGRAVGSRRVLAKLARAVAVSTAAMTASETAVEISGTASLWPCTKCSMSFTPTKPRIVASPVERYTSLSSSPETRKKSARSPSSANVRDEDDVGVIGHTEQRRDRIQREQDVGGRDRHQSEKRGRQAAPPRCGDQQIVVYRRILSAVTEELHGGCRQRDAEQQVGKRERVEHRGTERDQRGPEKQRASVTPNSTATPT